MSGQRQPGLGVALTACNSARTIRQVLESVQSVATKIVVVDSGSTDETPDICRDLGAEVVDQPWLGYAAQKQFAMDRCDDCAWTLLLDSDESLEPALRDSIRGVVEQDDPNHDGWWLNRKLWFLGGWLDHAYQPERRLRLARSGRFTVVGPDPHESVRVQGRTGRLEGDLRHDSYAGIDDFSRRIIRYSQIAAKDDTRGGSPRHLLINPAVAFIKQYLMKRAFLDGRRGLLVSCMDFNTTLLKHMMIAARKIDG